jgi:nitrite reductase (NADH) large subunit
VAKYLIIGAGVASFRAVQAIREQDPVGQIVVVSDDTDVFYYRAALPRLLRKSVRPEQLRIATNENIKALNFKVIYDMARSIEFEPRILRTLTGHSVTFEKVLLATGASPFVPVMKGRKLDGVFTFRTMGGAKSISERLGPETNAVICGGGVLGLETAFAARAAGAKTTLLVKEEHVGFPILDKELAASIEKALAAAEVDVRFGEQAVEFIGGKKLTDVYTSKDNAIAAEVSIVCLGVTPNVEFAKRAGLRVNEGILVDNSMHADIAGVYAAGDVCQPWGVQNGRLWRNQHWEHAAIQGFIAGINMAGGEAQYQPGPFFNSGSLFGIPYSLYGAFDLKGKGIDVHDLSDKPGVIHRAIFHGQRLLGAAVIGDRTNYESLLPLISGRADAWQIRDQLFAPDLDLKTESFQIALNFS